MNKKVVVLGGGTGLSCLLKGLKDYPIDLSAIVSVCDDGSSTGRLREEFNIPAVGDIRKVIVSLSETEPLVEELLNYRFVTNSGLNGHAVGNLLITALNNITGNMSEGISALGRILNLKGRVIPLTFDNVSLVAKMTDGSIIEGEHNITEANKRIKEVYYKDKAIPTDDALKAIREADCIIFSMGSLYTSIIPNLLCKELVKEIDKSKAKILYVCNMMTQPGETDNYKVSDHVKVINKYLLKRKIEYVISNSGIIDESIISKYATLEQKDQVIYDDDNLNKMNVKNIHEDFVSIENEIIRHDRIKLSFYIFSVLMKD